MFLFRAIKNMFDNIAPCGSSLASSVEDIDQESVQPQQAPQQPKEISVFRALFDRDDLMMHVFSYVDIPSIEGKKLLCKKWKKIIESPQFWNVRIFDFKMRIKDSQLPLKDAVLEMDPRDVVTLDQRKAFYTMSTVYDNLSLFFNEYAENQSEYPFTCNNGAITFHKNIKDSNSKQLFQLVRHDSREMEKIYQRLQEVCKNQGMKKHYHFGIVERKAIQPETSQESSSKENLFASSVVNEEEVTTKTHRILFQFLRIVNTLSVQKALSAQDLKKGFQNPSSVVFEDVTKNEIDLIKPSAEKTETHEVPLDRLCNVICPQDIFQELPLPLYSKRFRSGEFVVVQRSDRTYRFGKVRFPESQSCWDMHGVPEQEFVYNVLVKKGVRNEDCLSKSIPAGQIYSISPRVMPQVLDLLHRMNESF